MLIQGIPDDESFLIFGTIIIIIAGLLLSYSLRSRIMKKDVPFIATLGVISFLFLLFIIVPLLTPYDFVTVAKVSDEYPEPIYFTFHWVTEDELQVGKLITFDAKLRGLPYTQTNFPSQDIKLTFDERQLNYWSNKTDTQNNEILQYDSLIFRPNWENEFFETGEIVIRFIVPTYIQLELCDKNIPKCFFIENVIYPAPFDLYVQIETKRIAIGITLAIAVFSCFIIWSRIRRSESSHAA